MFTYPEYILNGDPDFDVNNIFIFLVSLTLIIQIAVKRMFNRYFSILIYGKMVLFLASTIIAIIAFNTSLLPSLRKNSPIIPARILECVVYPAFLVRVFITLDLRKYFRCLPIILAYSAFLIGNGFLLAFLMKYLYKNLPLIEMLIIGTTMTTTQPRYMIAFLSLNDSYKNVITYIEGESIVSLLITFPIMEYIMQWVTFGPITTVGTIIWYFLISHIVGTFIGWVSAKILIMAIRHLILNLETLFVIFMGSMLLLYVISIQFHISGFTTGLAFALVLNPEKSHLLDTHAEQLEMLVNLYCQLISDIVLFYCINKGVYAFNAEHIHNYFYCYTLLLCLRILSVSVIYPILKMRYKVRALHIYLHSLVYPTSTFSLIIATQFYQKTEMDSSLALEHNLFNCGLSIFINNFFCVNLLKWTHTGYISEPRVENMQRILNLIKDTRDREIAVMKLDRNYCDVNWTIVNYYAKFTVGYPYPPFKRAIDWECKERKYGHNYLDNQDCCVLCPNLPNANFQNQYEMKYINHRKLVASMIRSALMNKAKHCLISADCVEILLKVTELYQEKDSDQAFAILRYNARPQVLVKWLKKASKFLCVIKTSTKPRRKCYRVFYYIRINRIFQILNHALTIITLLPLILKWITSLFTITHERYYYTVAIFFFIFEFMVNIFSNAAITLKDGLKTYFKSFWQIMDFISTFGMTVECITLWLDYFSNYGYWVSSFSWLKYTRLFRFIRLVTMFLPKLMFSLEGSMQQRLEIAYESVLAFKDCINVVFLTLVRLPPSLVDQAVMEELISDMLDDKIKLQEIQLQLSNDYPLVEIVKSNTMINGAICCINDYLLKLKFQGFIDNSELILMKNMVLVKKSRQENLLPLVNATSLFMNQVWFTSNKAASDYLHNVSVLEKWPDQHVLVKAFAPVTGVYILISGQLLIDYRPRPINTRHYIHYNEFENNLITKGNSFGEIELMTNGHYPYTLYCNGECRTYFITKKALCEAMKMSNHPITGLESVLWKHKMMRLTSEILMYQGLYQYQDLWTINKSIQRAFVPDLRCYKVFIFLDTIRDIVLLEGQVMDFHTEEVYGAPCYIPRSVRKLILPKPARQKLDVDIFCVVTTKLMVIPLGEVTPTEVLAQEETVADMVEHDFSRCPYHVTQTKGKIQTRTIIARSSNFAMLKNMSTAIATISFDVRLPSPSEGMSLRRRFSLKSRRQLIEQQTE